jgi:hypothetical protein
MGDEGKPAAEQIRLPAHMVNPEADDRQEEKGDERGS